MGDRSEHLHLPYRAVAVIIPFGVLALHMALLYLTLPYDLFLLMIGLIIAYLLPPAGKETVIPVGIALGIPWWGMALSIVMIDVETALFMLLNFDLAYKIPFIGTILINVTRVTRSLLERYRWIGGLYIFGIILMVMVPVLGSGGVRGSIAGKILNIEPLPLFLAILSGSIIGCFGIALGSDVALTCICGSGLLPEPFVGIICNKTWATGI